MTRCAVRRGFFVLRDCGQPATGVCVACSRPVCSEHAVEAGAGLHCVECQARAAEAGPWQSQAAPFFYRRRFYAGQQYHPIYTGAYGHTYATYDDYDVRSFDRETTDDLTAEEAADAGFLDS